MDAAEVTYKRDKRALELGALPPLDIYRSESQVVSRRAAGPHGHDRSHSSRAAAILPETTPTAHEPGYAAGTPPHTHSANKSWHRRRAAPTTDPSLSAQTLPAKRSGPQRSHRVGTSRPARNVPSNHTSRH